MNNTTNNQNEIEKVSRILNSISEERHNNIEYSVLQVYLNSLGGKEMKYSHTLNCGVSN
jgi:hypothetical protein